MTRRPGLRIVAASLLLLCTTACGTQGLSFVKDDRVKITDPGDRSAVPVPFTVRWTVRDFAVTGPTATIRHDAGYFGVYLDRAPQPPGETFRWFAKDDKQCAVTPGCPDRSYFASKDAYSTSGTSMVITRLPDVQPDRERRVRDQHQITIALLDGTGRRIGESAFTVQFELKHETSR